MTERDKLFIGLGAFLICTLGFFWVQSAPVDEKGWRVFMLGVSIVASIFFTLKRVRKERSKTE